MALERAPGTDMSWLADLGVDVLTTTAIATQVGATAADVIWFMDTDVLAQLIGSLGQDPGPTGAAPKLVLDVSRLPSMEAASSSPPSGRNADGLETLVETLIAAEQPILDLVDLVVCDDDATTSAVRERTGTPATTIAPAAASVGLVRGTAQRKGVLHYGRWTSEPGDPDEAGLGLLAADLAPSDTVQVLDWDAVGPHLTVLSQDAPPKLRATVPRGVGVADPTDWVGQLRTTRVAVLPRPFGLAPTAAVAELCTYGVPFLTSAPLPSALREAPAAGHVAVASRRDWPDRLLQAMTDDNWWHAVSGGLADLRSSWLDQESQVKAIREALATLGVATGTPGVGRDHLSRVAVGSRGGASLRDSLDVRDFEARMLGRRLLGINADGPAHERIEPDRAYALWKAAHRDGAVVLEGQRRQYADGSEGPLFGLAIVVGSADAQQLADSVESIRAQTRPRWQLCVIAEDGSGSAVTEQLARLASTDPRITASTVPAGTDPAEAANLAFDRTDADFVARVDPGDHLRPSALHWVAELLVEHGDVDVVYTDEDVLDLSGSGAHPTFKPDWSPELLLSFDYIGQFVAYRREVFNRIGGLRSGLGVDHHHDAALRATEMAREVAHIAKPLYSRRPGYETVARLSEEAGSTERVVEDAVDRRGLDAHVRPGVAPGWHWVRRRPDERPLVSVLIPTRNKADLLDACIRTFATTVDYPNVELVVVDNESDDPATRAWLDAFETDGRGRVVRYPHRFNFARQINLAAAEARGSVLLMLNNDARPHSRCWFTELVGQALRPEVGAVGARLLWPDGSPQHEGVALDVGRGAAWNISRTDLEPFTRNTRDVVAVTGACLMVRRSVFDAVGGLDEQLRVAYNDVDFCLRIGELGYRIIYTPWAELVHAESSTRGALHPDDDEAFYRARWGEPGHLRDPFYNTNLEMCATAPYRV